MNSTKHYKGVPIEKLECIDIARHLSFDLGNAVKYIWRAGLKGGKKNALKDLAKAKEYIWDYKIHINRKSFEIPVQAKVLFDKVDSFKIVDIGTDELLIDKYLAIADMFNEPVDYYEVEDSQIDRSDMYDFYLWNRERSLIIDAIREMERKFREGEYDKDKKKGKKK